MFTRDLLDSSSPEQFETWSLRTSPEKGSRVRFGLIALFGAFVLLQNSGRRLRAVTTWQDVRPWLELLRTTVGMVVGGVVMMLASGLYMAHELYTYTSPWVVVGIVGGALVAISYPLMVGRKLLGLHAPRRRTRASCRPRFGPSWRDEGCGVPIFAMNGAALGIVWDMTSKSSWTVSILVPLGLAVMGVLIGARVGGAPHTVTRAEPESHPFPPPHPMARRRSAG